MGKKNPARRSTNPTLLNPLDPKNAAVVNAVIETPGGSRNKFKYDENWVSSRYQEFYPKAWSSPTPSVLFLGLELLTAIRKTYSF